MSLVSSDDISDESLMELIRGGDHEAFSLLVMRYTKMFYSAAYRICPDIDDAEDIVQAAFLKLWRRPQIWDSSRGVKFSTWFYRIVTNQAIDHIRKKKISNGADMLDRIKDEAVSQHEALEISEQQAMLESAIQSLPERQKIALNLCFYEGLSNKDAADVLGVGVKALESLLMRAKSGLRDKLLSKKEERGSNYG